MKTSYTWYKTLRKPTWAPPSWLFGPVWTLLYCGIAVSFGAVFLDVLKGVLPFSIAIPFILNLIFNFSFTPLQFGLKNNFYAAIDVALTLVTLIWSIVAIFPYIHWVAYANLPYLCWVLFATTLQFTVTYLNR